MPKRFSNLVETVQKKKKKSLMGLETETGSSESQSNALNTCPFLFLSSCLLLKPILPSLTLKS